MDRIAIQSLIDSLITQLGDNVENKVTIASWSIEYLSIIKERGYHPHTLKNRCANINHAAMTDLYKDDRGLTAGVYKRVALPNAVPV